MKQRTKESRKRLNSLILLVAFSAILLIASTYAWFAAQRDVTISNLEGKVEVSEGLEISLDADNWSQEIDLSQKNLKTDAYSGNNNIEPAELLPASTLGAAGEATMPLYRGTAEADDGKVKLTNIAAIEEDAEAGFFAFDVFLRNSTRGEEDDELYLTKKSMATVLQSTGRFSSRAGKSNTGVQNTVRVALALYDTTADVIADQTAALAALNTGSEKVSKVTIWEPNANYHVDYVTKNYGKVLTVPADFANYTQSTGLTKTAQIKTFALTGSVASIADSYDWTSAGLAEQKTVQTTITVPVDGEPTSYEMTQAAGKDTSGLKLATNGTTAFTLPANKITKARVYVWLEGQDVDCINYASHGGGIEVNLGIEKPSKSN